MPFKKGHPKHGGRQSGSRNKSTIAVKEALVEAFDKLGGVKSLVTWGQRNRGEFYKLWGRMMPTEISGPGGKPITLRIIEKIVDGDTNEDGQGSANSESLSQV